MLNRIGFALKLRTRKALRRVYNPNPPPVGISRSELKIDLTGKIAIVTGGSGGLGRTITRTLARAGADVIVHYHQDQSQAELLTKEAADAGRRAVAIQADMTDLASVERLRDAAVARLGAPDILVQNAVSPFRYASVLEQEPAEFEQQFRVSVLQGAHLAKAFLPRMMEKGGGRVIGISSETAILCGGNTSPYASSKRALDGLYRVLAREVGPHGITVNQVAPGWIITDRDRLGGTDRFEPYEETVPLKRRGSDEDVANVVAFLASDLAGFITGAFIPVTGGHVFSAI